MKMAAGLATLRVEQYQGNVTAHLVVTCIIAAIGGLIFGYVGYPGGVTSTEGYYEFFSEYVYIKENTLEYYCKYDSQFQFGRLLLLYLPGIVASLIASPVTRRYGRKKSIVIGGIIFCIAAALLVASALGSFFGIAFFLGQIMLGLGIGFGTQAILLYLSEIAPTRFRGGSTFMFQLANSIGILTANIVNYVTRYHEPWSSHIYNGYAVSFGVVALLALLMTVGGIFLSETPNSLIQRGSKEKGRKVLERLRGTENVEAEFEDMVAASELASTVKHPFFSIFRKKNRPQLVIAILMPLFQSLTGMNSLLYYASILFLNMGYREKSSLYSSVIIGATLVLSTLLSMALVDRFGRKALLISGGILMIICQVIIAIILVGKVGDHQNLSRTLFILLMVVISLFALAFGWSWGPLGWTIPSEIFPLEVRSAGQSITVAMNLLFTSIVAESFLPQLCAFRFGLFLFYAGWITAMTIFVYLFLPETKGVPIEEMTSVWRKHWFWKKIVPAQQGQTLP